MILYGAGAFLVKIYETACRTTHPPKAYFIEPTEPSPPLPISLLGTYHPHLLPEEPIFLAFLDNTLRRNLSRRIQHPLANPIIHPTARVHPSASIGHGTFIGPHASIEEDTTIGPFVIIEENAFIGSASSIAEGTYIGPSCQIAPRTAIGAYVYIGAGTVLQADPPLLPLHIEEGTIIGPNLRIFNSYPPFSWHTSERSWPVR